MNSPARCEQNYSSTAWTVNKQFLLHIIGLTFTLLTTTFGLKQVDLCEPSPCVNGQCVDRFFDHRCLCWAGWTGAACDVQINECDSNPCVNGGKCEDLENDYRCTCPVGLTGKNCQHSVDYCAAEPCKNGGSCTNSVENFVCQCRPGFLGLQCEIDIDECLDNPCDPVGTDRCLDQVRS